MPSTLQLAIVLAMVLSPPAFLAQERAQQTAGQRDVADFYERTGHRAVWVDDQGRPTGAAWTVLARLRAAHEDGLDVDDYRGTTLEFEATALEQGIARASADAAAFDVGLTTSALKFLRELHLGRVDPRALGFHLDHAVEPHDFPALLQSATVDHSFEKIVAGLRPQFMQ
ncbi:MAG: hypothetical protein EHM55_06860, partial [Acidobacteria bacterium]